MNIWMVQTGEPSPFDGSQRLMRTGTLAQELVRRGHQVTWWASRFDHVSKRWLNLQAPVREELQQVQFRWLRGLGYPTNISMRRFLDHRLLSWKAAWALRSEPPPDLILASSPPYDLAAKFARYAAARGVPLIVDVRDPWPDLFVELLPLRARSLGRLLLASEFRTFRRCVRQSDLLLAVSDALLQTSLGHAAPRPPARSQVLHNWYRALPPAPVQHPALRAIADQLQGRFVVAYLGIFGDIHDPRPLVEAARALDPERVQVVLAGEGDTRAALQALAGGLGHIHFTGWLNETGMRELLSLAHVGVCPTPFDNTVLPNKAILYLSAGLPILSSFGGELRQLIERHGCGTSFTPGSPSELAQAINQLANDPSLYRSTADAAAHLFQAEFDADRLIPEYVSLIEDLARQRSGRS